MLETFILKFPTNNMKSFEIIKYIINRLNGHDRDQRKKNKNNSFYSTTHQSVENLRHRLRTYMQTIYRRRYTAQLQ
jgi:hypothetical protein